MKKQWEKVHPECWSTGVSSKINQICMVIEKVNQENKPIENYTKTLQNIYGAVASELNISKSPVVDKCNRQLGLTAMEFAKYVRELQRRRQRYII